MALLVHRGYLDGYLLHRTCVFMVLRLFFLPNISGLTFNPCPTSILEARVLKRTRLLNQEKENM